MGQKRATHQQIMAVIGKFPLRSHSSFSRMMIGLPIQLKNDYNLVYTPRAGCLRNELISQKVAKEWQVLRNATFFDSTYIS